MVDEVKFAEMCQAFRVAKIKAKEAKKVIDSLGSQIKEYAQSNELDGDMHGIKIVKRYNFAVDDNIAIAEKLSLTVPTKTIINYPQEYIDKILKSVDIPEEFYKHSPDIKKLKELFEKEEIEGVYELNYSLSLSSVE